MVLRKLGRATKKVANHRVKGGSIEHIGSKGQFAGGSGHEAVETSPCGHAGPLKSQRRRRIVVFPRGYIGRRKNEGNPGKQAGKKQDSRRKI